MTILLAILFQAFGPASPMPAPPVVQPTTCPATGDYVRMRPDAVLLAMANEIGVGPSAGTTAGVDRAGEITVTLANNDLTRTLTTGRVLMLQEPRFPNTGAGIMVDSIAIQPDGIHVVGHGQSWIAEQRTPRLDAALAARPWEQPRLTTATVLVEDPSKPKRTKNEPAKIEDLIRDVAFCR